MNDNRFSRQAVTDGLLDTMKQCITIQPYWKGAMRHLKMDAEGREREIIIQEEND